jgi:hypothetical protein
MQYGLENGFLVFEPFKYGITDFSVIRAEMVELIKAGFFVQLDISNSENPKYLIW